MVQGLVEESPGRTKAELVGPLRERLTRCGYKSAELMGGLGLALRLAEALRDLEGSSLVHRMAESGEGGLAVTWWPGAGAGEGGAA